VCWQGKQYKSSSQLTCRRLAAVAVQAIPRVVDADLIILTTTKPSAEPLPPTRPASPPLLVGLNIFEYDDGNGSGTRTECESACAIALEDDGVQCQSSCIFSLVAVS
jgi:hypothetical protein